LNEHGFRMMSNANQSDIIKLASFWPNMAQQQT